jgi:hypothetical protein
MLCSSREEADVRHERWTDFDWKVAVEQYLRDKGLNHTIRGQKKETIKLSNRRSQIIFPDDPELVQPGGGVDTDLQQLSTEINQGIHNQDEREQWFNRFWTALHNMLQREYSLSDFWAEHNSAVISGGFSLDNMAGTGDKWLFWMEGLPSGGRLDSVWWGPRHVSRLDIYPQVKLIEIDSDGRYDYSQGQYVTLHDVAEWREVLDKNRR